MSNPESRFVSSRGFARALGAVGRLMITTGIVLLLLVAYQLWGTNLQTGRAQDRLAGEFDRAAAPGATSSTTAPSTTAASTTAPSTTAGGPPGTVAPKVAPTIAPPGDGEVVGRISIPSIGVHDFYFVEGTSIPQLKEGAGHYAGTPLPGQKGNAAIAGHRTTYGAPFHNIDKVANGDEISVETRQGTFTYAVTGREIVEPTKVSVLDDAGDNRLTLTACHPKFSAKQRIIVTAELKGRPVPQLKGQAAAARQVAAQTPDAIDEFEQEPVLHFPGAWWGAACVGLWLVVRLVAWRWRHSRRSGWWIAYLLGTPACLVLLYLFFESFNYEAFARTINLAV